MMIGEKNIASAMSVITAKQIKQASSAQSIYSILKLTPSVNEYQQNIGPGVPVLTVRGIRMSQLAQTLDGVPMISLLSGGEGAYLSYNIGSVVTTGQLSGIHVYPGVAPPSRGGFATVGGTIAYKTKSPSTKPDVKIFSKIGSFNTNTYGVSANTGKIPGADGLRLYTRLSRTTSDGYIDYTPSKYTDFMFGAVKPYDYGLSKITATVLYNTSSGYLLAAPIPVNLLNKYGRFYNYTPSDSSIQQKNSI
jgi:Outer membrane receptor for Fe3+-dicitrate